MAVNECDGDFATISAGLLQNALVSRIWSNCHPHHTFPSSVGIWFPPRRARAGESKEKREPPREDCRRLVRPKATREVAKKSSLRTGRQRKEEPPQGVLSSGGIAVAPDLSAGTVQETGLTKAHLLTRRVRGVP